MLHITNGSSAARSIEAAGFTGTIVPWQDALHDGPVPAGLTMDELRAQRARFISACGWATFDQVMADFGRRDAALADFGRHDETVLWFEHDLYDQLQLLQILAWFARQDLAGVNLSLVQASEYLGPAAKDRLRELFAARRAITGDQRQLGRVAWQAFCSPDPLAILKVMRDDTTPLPYLGAAFRRHLQQFPSTSNGLARSEQQALLAIARGSRTLGDAFVSSQMAEESAFLGDTIFAWYLQRLGGRDHPLVAWADGEPLAGPGSPITHHEFASREVLLTDLGKAVLDGESDWIAVAGIDRWLGGAHLTTARFWRWDQNESRLQQHGAE